jgi:hypothetical protein
MAATTVPAPVRTSMTPPVPTAISQWAARVEFTDLDEIAVRGKEQNSPTSPRDACPVAKKLRRRAYCYERGIVYLGSASGFA